MKKNKKFVKFPVINAKTIIVVITSAILFVSFFSAMGLFISENLSSHMVELVVHAGLKTPYTPPQINIARTLLTASVPGIVFTQASTEPTETAQLPTEPATELVFENTAQSITYENAEEKGYKSIDGIYINNQTNKSFDISQLLNKALDLSLSDGPSVLIVHTHTTESYTPSSTYNYTPTETDRTTDPSFNMVAVGEVIYNYLTSQGINVIHDKSINDYPSYSTSYSKSLKLVESYTKQYPSIKIVIDVHRDAIVTANGTKLRPIASKSPSAAQVMLVVGTNASGLSHPLWESNLSFALKLQHQMNTLYPSLARPINLRRERFNQHLAPFAFILEVGTNGNTLDEAKEGAKLFSEALASLLKV